MKYKALDQTQVHTIDYSDIMPDPALAKLIQRCGSKGAHCNLCQMLEASSCVIYHFERVNISPPFLCGNTVFFVVTKNGVLSSRPVARALP